MKQTLVEEESKIKSSETLSQKQLKGIQNRLNHMEAAEDSHRAKISDLLDKEKMYQEEINMIRIKDKQILTQEQEKEKKEVAQIKYKQEHDMEVQITKQKLEMEKLMKLDEEQLVKQIKADKESEHKKLDQMKTEMKMHEQE